jgi:hypothetical protein
MSIKNSKSIKKCCPCCRGPDMDVERFLRLDGYTDPHNTISNAVNNQKYNIINFLPLVLFNQFKLFFNFFQLAINLSQFVPILKVGNDLFIIRVSIHLFVSTYNGYDADSW